MKWKEAAKKTGHETDMETDMCSFEPRTPVRLSVEEKIPAVSNSQLIDPKQEMSATNELIHKNFSADLIKDIDS